MKSLLVSVLSLGRAQDVLGLLATLPTWLAEFAQDYGFAVHLVVRNNDPNADFSEVCRRLAECEVEQPALRCTLLTGEPNLGFGRGHNANYRLFPSDYLLVLNDDIGLPHLHWLPEAIGLLERDPRTACVGAEENPKYLNPMFGSGHERPALAVETLKYAEASVLLLNGKVFEQVGMFDERLAWAMCEDADISLRAQQLGFRLHWMPMPHQHWRSTSVNSLPAPVRQSILEHNRATLFASWSQALATGRIGRVEVFDLNSDGMGDIFCLLPHLRAWLAGLPPARREHIVVNSNHRELVDLLDMPGIRVTREPDRNALISALEPEGISALHSIRDINYALPLNLHPLLCGSLGLPVCDDAGMAAFQAALRDAATRSPDALPSGCCVVHLEFARDHQGRGLAPASVKSILTHCSRLFETVVLIGKERRLSLDDQAFERARVIDLQGRLRLRELIETVAGATYFVGIDSLPAHIAQAAGIRSAVFFGSVHPLARVWNETLVWPLVAELDCIGCYHAHLESSAPFCLRRDEACAAGPRSLQSVLEAMLRGEPFDWSGQRRRFAALQARWLSFLRHHPSPPERLLRPAPNGNEAVANLVHRILDQATELAGARYRASSVGELTERVRELEARLFARDVELDEMRQRARPKPETAQPASSARPPIRIAQLANLSLRARQCIIRPDGQWLDVEAAGNDPQLQFPAIRGIGGRVQLRLTATCDRADTLQVFWAFGAEDFAEERQRSIGLSSQPASLDLTLDLAEAQLLRLRIDPLLAKGRMRLRGSISGAFELREDAPAAAELNVVTGTPVEPEPPVQRRALRGRKAS
jgi:hypothetical protein